MFIEVIGVLAVWAFIIGACVVITKLDENEWKDK